MNKHDETSPVVVITACKAALLNAHGQVLLLRRSSTHPTMAHQWDLPGGLWEGGSFEETIIRETQEETGLTAEDVKLWRAAPELQEDGKYKLYLSFVGKVHAHQITLSKEHEDYAWVGPHDAGEYQLPLVWENVLLGALEL